MSLKLIINGNNYFFQKNITLLNLLYFLGINVNTIAIEYNELLLQKNEYKNVLLKDKDKIEIVSIVGGG